jgi:hypothetical protein
MSDSPSALPNTTTSKIVLCCSVFVSIFWMLANSIDIYSNKFVGIIFEILWLPILALTCIIPVVSFIFLFKEKFSLRSLYLYALFLLLLAALTIKFLIL